MNIAGRAVLGALLLAGFPHAAQPAAAASDTHHHHADHQLVGAVASGDGLPDTPLEIGELEAARVQRYVHDVQVDEVARYLVAVAEAEHAAEQARLAAQPTVRIPDSGFRNPESTPSAGAGGACGGATNGADQYIGRETRGSADPANQYNLQGSGAWGCYQLMPEHFAPGGTCSDFVYGQASAAQQAECASRLPLSAWGGG